MAELPGGRSATAGTGRGGNGAARGGPVPVPSPSGAAGIKGPRDIMRERNAREERKRAEQVAVEQARIEEEQRLAEEDRRRAAEERAATEVRNGGTEQIGRRTSQRERRAASSGMPSAVPLQGRGTEGAAVGGGDGAWEQPGASRARGAGTASGQPQSTTAPDPTRPSKPTAQPEMTSEEGLPRRPAQSSFPHAFERWETLSAHWEGLTSYWIRRLEENSNEVSRDPLGQQMSRQITDLAAAGANLFHAVVELQRLRASSERKFQRWFFETRTERERSQEMIAGLEQQLIDERKSRAESVAEAVAREKARGNFEKLLAEKERELKISKDEARRAWEELGRREQEERDRTMSLRDGLPTLVGGVQVVPMMQGGPRQGGSSDRPQSRGGPVRQSPEAGADDSDSTYRQYVRGRRNETGDPFVETARPTGAPAQSPVTPPGRSTATAAVVPSGQPQYAQAPSVQPPSSGAWSESRQAVASPISPLISESPYSDEGWELDSQGDYVLDPQGNRIRYHSPSSDHGFRDTYGRAPVGEVEYGSGSTPTGGRPGGMYIPDEDEVDYEGAGYGDEGIGAGWEAVPRHHHPTRLSDVLEEDERSRTSASQVSHNR